MSAEEKGTCTIQISGLRSEVFGELTFIDHAEVPFDDTYKMMFLIICDGATSMMTSFPCETKLEDETTDYLLLGLS